MNNIRQIEEKERQKTVLSNGVKVEYPKGKRLTSGRLNALVKATNELSKIQKVHKIHLNENFKIDKFYNIIIIFDKGEFS